MEKKTAGCFENIQGGRKDKKMSRKAGCSVCGKMKYDCECHRRVPKGHYRIGLAKALCGKAPDNVKSATEIANRVDGCQTCASQQEAGKREILKHRN